MTRAGARHERTVVVTTSWDDGHLLDARLSAMLAARRIAGTFYIAPDNIELPSSERLDPAAVRELSESFEIGGHTASHRRLTGLSPEESAREIRAGKEVLEDLTGRPLVSFAYPGGAFSPRHTADVERAGFRCARTTERGCTTLGPDPYRMGTTVQARQHVLDWPRVVLGGWRHPAATVRCLADWATLAAALFDRVLANGGVFHLWGHSWEIDRFGQWSRLETVLDHVSNRPGVVYATNAETLDVLAQRVASSDEPDSHN